MIALWLSLLLACQTSEPSVSPEPAQPPPPLADTPLPEDSLYQLDIPLEDQSGRHMELADFRGQPILISMFYANCPMACPLLIEDVRSLRSSLTADERKDLRVLFVSLDPDRDTPTLMTEVAERHELDTSLWTMTRTDQEKVRLLATTLSIRYRDLGNGEMNHSSIITLLDSEGRITAQLEGLESDPATLITAYRSLSR